jgi:hypothetical protein
MLETMYVRCTHCGYDNSPEYRFCGMCGGSLPHPVTETRPPVRDVAPPPPPQRPVAVSTPDPVAGSASGSGETVHGPSFLGLSQDPRVEFSYLYEEEPTRSHAGLIAVLLLLVGGGGFLGWQWRHHGFPFNRMNAASSSNQQAPPAPSVAAPDVQQSQADKPATGTGDVLPTAPDQKSDASASSNTPAQAQPSPASPPEDGATRPAEKTENAEATPPPSTPKKSHATKLPPKAAVAPKPAKVETASLATPPDADLELAGERYLYGSGLPQNCSRAESSLRTAALHGNSKAQTVLGTMYATGHCVGRDLPTAYRWFARALHQDPQNSRISADLQVLWRQMTPQEKQLATGSKQ